MVNLSHDNYGNNVNHGILLFSNTGHTNVPVTHPHTFSYLPTDMTAFLTLHQLEANSMLFYRTSFVIRHVIRWLVYCALDEQCIAPDINRFCDASRLNSSHYIGCHRFDQSVINIVLANVFNYQFNDYLAADNILNISRLQRLHSRLMPRVCTKPT